LLIGSPFFIRGLAAQQRLGDHGLGRTVTDKGSAGDVMVHGLLDGALRLKRATLLRVGQR
jgi:hypothetical protein